MVTRDDLERRVVRAGLPTLVLSVPAVRDLRRTRGVVALVFGALLVGLGLIGAIASNDLVLGYVLPALAALYVAWLLGMLGMLRHLGVHALEGMARSGAAAVSALAPMLIVILFLFYTTEIWQVFGAGARWRILALLSIFAILATGVLWAALAQTRRLLYDTGDGAQVAARATAVVPDLSTIPAPAPLALTALQRRNIALTLTVAMLMRVVAVALVSGVVLAVLGLVTLEPSVMQAWSGDTGLAPLLNVAAILGGFAGLSFVVVAASEPRARRGLVEAERVRLEGAIALASYAARTTSAGG